MFHENTIREAINTYNKSTDCIFWKDLQSNYRMMNNEFARLVGFKSSNASFNNFNDFAMPCEASDLADKFIAADQEVIRTGKPVTSIEYCRYIDGAWRVHYDRKSPLFNSRGEMIGISSHAMDVTDCPIMRSVIALTSPIGKCHRINQQQSYQLKTNYDNFDLSVLQSEILFLMLRGMSSKEIARRLGRSPRTIEKHRTKIKEKMGCQNQSQLFEKTIASGAGLFIPQSLLGKKEKSG
ncbi:MAG: helix-turn-helix transcriptional regulator [Gammaproteobacteria bacterium]|nr:helix-turn-helix transcriptional regulator [Gammaproteobacteria bacterium]